MTNKLWVYVVAMGICACLFSCDNSNENKPVFGMPLNITEADTFYGDGEYAYIISKHEIFFSNEGWMAYKNEEGNEYYTAYAYKWPDDQKDTTVRRYFATNETMFIQKIYGPICSCKACKNTPTNDVINLKHWKPKE